MISLGNTVILGDSYSTFEGFIPKGYVTYFSDCSEGTTDVNKVEQTWWHMLLENAEMSLLRNDSFSGSTICYTGYDGEDCRRTSFIGRMEHLISEGFFRDHRVDTLLIFGGTNDCWAGSPPGEKMDTGWKEKDLYFVAPAVSYLLHLSKETLPETRIIFILNSGLSREINEIISEACGKYGIELLALGNLEKSTDHPTVRGMKELYRQVSAYLEKTAGGEKTN